MLKSLKFITKNNSNKFKHVLIKGKKVLGFIEYRKGKKISNITNINVNKEEQNKGYGSKLINYFEEKLDSKINEIKVCSTSESVEFYKKNGYIKDDLYDDYFNQNLHYHKYTKDN